MKNKTQTLSKIVSAAAVTAMALSLGVLSATAALGDISTIAGTGTSGYSGDGGPATSAQLNRAYGIAVAPNGDVYIADQLNYRIRKIDSSGNISTVAGTGVQGYSGDGGPATSAQIDSVAVLAFDAAGDLYIADSGNARIRKIDSSGNISTVVGTGQSGFSGDGGQATSAKIWNPQGLAFDADGNMYIGEYMGDKVRKVNTSGIITTIAGTGVGGFTGDGGQATSAKVNKPYGVAVDGYGNVYFNDSLNNRLRKIDTNGIITTIAGDGTGGSAGDGGAATSARLNYPTGLTIDSAGNLYIGDMSNSKVRMINTNGVISTVAGNGTGTSSGDGGAATSAGLPGPIGVAIDSTGNLYVLEGLTHRARKIEQTVVASTTTTSTSTTTTTTTTTVAPTTTTAASSSGSSNSSGSGSSKRDQTGGSQSLPETGLSSSLVVVAGLLAIAAGIVTVSRRRLSA